jgi:hypothetical protein
MRTADASDPVPEQRRHNPVPEQRRHNPAANPASIPTDAADVIVVIVTSDGGLHGFTGAAIPGVCETTRSSVQTHISSVKVGWNRDWSEGAAWPQASWDLARLWLVQQAPGIPVDPETFEAFVRRHWPKTAERWGAMRV